MQQLTPTPAANPIIDKTEAVNTATRFLTTLFDVQDLILFRPVETWVEDGRKRSRADYRNTRYRKAVPEGRKKARKYFVEDGDRVFLDQRHHTSNLSPKAQTSRTSLPASRPRSAAITRPTCRGSCGFPAR